MKEIKPDDQFVPAHQAVPIGQIDEKLLEKLSKIDDHKEKQVESCRGFWNLERNNVKWKVDYEDPLLDAETFKINSDQYLETIGQKPDTIEEIQGQYMGLLHFKPDRWSKVKDIRSKLTKKEFDKIHMTDLLRYITN